MQMLLEEALQLVVVVGETVLGARYLRVYGLLLLLWFTQSHRHMQIYSNVINSSNACCVIAHLILVRVSTLLPQLVQFAAHFLARRIELQATNDEYLTVI
jgi:hypothetical protein